MVWYTMADPSGSGGWAFNPDGAAHVIRSNHYNRELVRRSRIIRRDHGFLMPSTMEVEIDFTGIREEVNRLAAVTVNQLDRDFGNNPRRLYEWLCNVRQDGESAGGEYRTRTTTASRQSAQSINENVDRWENALTAAKFVRDASASILFVGATVLSGGAALAVGGAGAGLTFAGGTQDNLASNQTLRQAMGNAAISTGVAVVTNVLIPRGLNVVGRGITGVTASGVAARSLTMGENVVMGLISVQANIAGDAIKTALTADTASGPVSAAAANQMQRQIGARAGFEVTAMLFQSWLASRGIPASAFFNTGADGVNSVTGGVISAVGDRIVSAISAQNTQASQGQVGGARPGDMDLIFSQIRGIMEAEAYVRQVAMSPA